MGFYLFSYLNTESKIRVIVILYLCGQGCDVLMRWANRRRGLDGQIGGLMVLVR